MKRFRFDSGGNYWIVYDSGTGREHRRSKHEWSEADMESFIDNMNRRHKLSLV